MSLRAVSTEAAPVAIGPYSQGIIAGGFLYTAGQIALDPSTAQVVEGDVVAQTKRVLQNLEAVLAAAGASWKDVVKTTVFLQDMKDFPRMNDVYAAVMGDARPARSTVQVAGLPRGVLVEIELVAHLG
ncbi:MAG TPA: RidA family protein [Gemmatimonadaceae bacterium]|nr:RidA family protein [Gemmatimonadaceae bacterium]